MSSTRAAGVPSLPLVVQVGFAGSRKLVDTAAHPRVDLTEFERLLQAELERVLARLPADLGLSPQHFCCGISQVAIGADMIFTRACKALGWRQRIFLPQTRDEFLAAGDPNDPDFSETERAEALRLLESEHVVQERVVSDANVREERFEDVSAEIVRVSDLVVCLIRKDAKGARGGTRSLAEEAEARQLSVLTLEVSVENGRPKLEEHWPTKARFEPPTMPGELDQMSARLTPATATATSLYDALLGFGREVADRRKRFFKRAAQIIILSHVAATIVAGLAIKLADEPAWHRLLLGLLVFEIVGLGLGFVYHWRLHQSRASEVWALSRLVAEIGRSGKALLGIHAHLSHLFSLPFPHALRPLLRTINVLHLEETRRNDAEPNWQSHRARYLGDRLTNGPAAQRPYYERERDSAERWARRAQRVFATCSALAFGAASVKLIWSIPAEGHHEPWGSVLAVAAIVLPVMAVAAVSLAAALDLEARIHTFSEMADFLKDRADDIAGTVTERAFLGLALRTEERLLGENVSWYARRAYTGVA